MRGAGPAVSVRPTGIVVPRQRRQQMQDARPVRRPGVLQQLDQERRRVRRRLVDRALVPDVPVQMVECTLAGVRVPREQRLELSRHVGRRAVCMLQRVPRHLVQSGQHLSRRLVARRRPGWWLRLPTWRSPLRASLPLPQHLDLLQQRSCVLNGRREWVVRPHLLLERGLHLLHGGQRRNYALVLDLHAHQLRTGAQGHRVVVAERMDMDVHDALLQRPQPLVLSLRLQRRAQLLQQRHLLQVVRAERSLAQRQRPLQSRLRARVVLLCDERVGLPLQRRGLRQRLLAGRRERRPIRLRLEPLHELVELLDGSGVGMPRGALERLRDAVERDTPREVARIDEHPYQAAHRLTCPWMRRPQRPLPDDQHPLVQRQGRRVVSLHFVEVRDVAQHVGHRWVLRTERPLVDRERAGQEWQRGLAVSLFRQDSGEIVQRPTRLQAVRAARALVDAQRPLVVPARCWVILLCGCQHTQIAQTVRRQGIVRPQRPLADGQRPLVEAPRRLVVALHSPLKSQIVEGLGSLGVVRAKQALPDGQHMLHHRLGPGGIALLGEHERQRAQGLRRRQIVVPQRCLPQRQGALEQIPCVGVLAAIVVLLRRLVQARRLSVSPIGWLHWPFRHLVPPSCLCPGPPQTASVVITCEVLPSTESTR